MGNLCRSALFRDKSCPFCVEKSFGRESHATSIAILVHGATNTGGVTSELDRTPIAIGHTHGSISDVRIRPVRPIEMDAGVRPHRQGWTPL